MKAKPVLAFVTILCLHSRGTANIMKDNMETSISSTTNDIARLSLSSSADSDFVFSGKSEESSYPSSTKHTSKQRSVEDRKVEVNDEKRLLDYLIAGYNSDVRPVRNASHPIVIKLSITLTQIFDMDEKNQVLTTNVWLDQEWMDELLTWDPVKYNGLETIRLPCEKIWLPDIVLYNSADDYTRGYMKSRAMVSYKGKVFWPPPTKFRSTCPVDVTYFPFDDQTCILKLGSWIYDGFQVDVTNRTAVVDLTNYIPNGEWELLEAGIIRNVIFYSCCPEPFPDVTITIIIRRKTLYYIYNVVLPCMMMSILTLLAFCLPPDSGEKIALGVTVLLAFSVFMLAIAEKMPETSESIPLIGIYLTTVMSITSVSIIMTVTVLNCHYRGPTQNEVPPWVRRYFLERNLVKKMINGTLSTRQGGMSWSKLRKKKWSDGLSGLRGLKRRTDKASMSTIEEIHGNKSPTRHYRDYTNNVIKDFIPKNDMVRITVGQEEQNDTQHSDLLNTNEDISFGWKECDMNVKRTLSSSNSPAGASARWQRSQDEMMKILKQLLNKQQYEDKEKKRLNEWRTLAIFIDRILFWIFLLFTSISSLVFLVVLPMMKRAEYTRKT